MNYKMKKIYIWGAGNYLELVYNTINKELCIVLGIIDSDKKKQNKKWINDILIQSPEKLLKAKFDYLVISVKAYEQILQECLDMGINNDKIIPFWKSDEQMPFMDKIKAILNLEVSLEKYKWRLENLPYELGLGDTPRIESSICLLNKVIENKISVCRFGDGEFEIMRGNERPWFQCVDERLALRLHEIFKSEKNNIIIAIANNFGNLDCYTEDAADAIRSYMYGKTRNEIMGYINMQYTYYDAYVTRPYMIYKDKRKAEDIFNLYKKIWKNRKILIVEGIYTRMGVGNDLFLNSSEVKRIICPQKNAFNKYEKILNSVRRNTKGGELVLISLGPTATVLTYDLAQDGIQAFDIGQLDNEYEWFLAKVNERSKIPGKLVSELVECFFPYNILKNDEYEHQIIDRIID